MGDNQNHDNQKQVAAWLAVAILGAASVAALWLAATSIERRYLDTSDSELVSLTTAWTIAGYFIKNGALINSLFAAFLAVLSVAITFVAEIYTRKRDIAIISALCVIGIAAATFALVQMSRGATLEHLTYYGEFAGAEASKVEGMVRGFFGALIGWFGTFLAAVLGISLTMEDGVLRGARPSPPSNPPAGPTPGAGQS